ncbi:IS256 family transposase, partial [Catenovulum maritimum]
MTQEFDFNEALKQLQSGKALVGKDGVLTPLIKQLTEAALKAELEQHLEDDIQPNRKNGSTSKTIKTSTGEFELETPRDRAGSFEPQLIKKNQTKLSEEIDHKILSMFSMGLSYRDIRKHVADLYE